MDVRFQQMLACPRCRGDLSFDEEKCSCQRCGASFTVDGGIPRLNDDALHRDPRVAAEWTAQIHAHPLYSDPHSVLNHWEEHALSRTLDWLAGVRGPVLDVGCGIGELGRVLSRRAGIGLELVGLDLQADLLADVTEGYAALVEGDIHRLPFKDAQFSAVILSNALHHVAEPAAAMTETARVLLRGGVVVAYDPRRVGAIEAVKRVVRRNNEAFTEVHRAFQRDEYRALLEGAGLSVHRLVAVDPVGPLVATGLDLLRVGRFGAAAIARRLQAVDRAVERRDRRGRAGLMLLARAQLSEDA